ncbi:MAG TPA: TatD family hydrolase [Saprospiraceae bacterium]|nr:TatD family hydrolase [Saprospiraceae bacterium]
MIFVDTHAHIYSEEFKNDLDDIISRAKDANILEIFMPNVDLSTISLMNDVNARYPNCHCMMGLHPCSVEPDYQSVLKEIQRIFKESSYVGIGEVGIDLYWEKKYFEEQKKAFQYQIDWARDTNLPVIIHSRESLDITIEMIENSQNGNLSGIFHCFTGDESQASKIMDAGFYLGIGGVVTYKNSELIHVLRKVGIDKVVLETDAPYLPPVPKRGKRNEPSYIEYILNFLCSELNLTKDYLSNITMSNVKKIFDTPFSEEYES